LAGTEKFASPAADGWRCICLTSISVTSVGWSRARSKYCHREKALLGDGELLRHWDSVWRFGLARLCCTKFKHDRNWLADPIGF
jgi:hypothetical protein